MAANPIPEGFHSVTPHMVVRGAADAIAFYARAFGAEELVRMPMPTDPEAVMHAEIRIGNSIVMLMDPMDGACNADTAATGASPVTLHLYVPDTDAAIARAVEAGASVTMPPADMFWGDRYGQVLDPFGHRWSIATHVRTPTPEQMAEGAAAMFAAGGPAA